MNSKHGIWVASALGATLVVGVFLRHNFGNVSPRELDHQTAVNSLVDLYGLPPDTPVTIESWRAVPDFPRMLVQFETVFWEPLDTVSLRQLIRDGATVVGKSVLEIGTGTGLVALCCARAGAARVVATDINPSAVANAIYNAEIHELAQRVEVRRVSLASPAAFSVIGDDERFDLIISNPPWENARPGTIADHALYDEHFELLRSLLEGLDQHLTPGGKCWLAYGCVDAVNKVHELAAEYQLRVQILDQRDLDSLPNVFLPGMLLEITRITEDGDVHLPTTGPSPGKPWSALISALITHLAWAESRIQPEYFQRTDTVWHSLFGRVKSRSWPDVESVDRLVR